MARQKGRLLLGVAFLATIVVVAPTTARAQSASADRQMPYSIPAQGLSDALRQLASASGLQLVYDTTITDGKASPGVSGTMSSRAALAAVLAGSGLGFQFSGDRTVIITASAASTATDGVRSVGVVSVEGAGGPMPFGEMVSPVNGTNGSRDVETTEGTGSYTTGATSIVSKIPMTLKETPQTVSVVTSQRIDDQALVNIKDVLQTMPGVTATPGANSEEFDIYSRGFRVTTYSFDGGAPVTFAFNNRPALNISEFDSVQLARGATGLFSGYGDPGGVVNLVRKKPLDHYQASFEVNGGSWKNFREEADFTGPLTHDKSLRARLVVSQQDRKYYYDVADSHKTGVYGIIEYDLSSKDLMTVGASYNVEHNRPNQSGLPRYSDGTAIDWPVSTCLCSASVFDNSRKTEVFGSLSHQFNPDWSTKLNVTYTNQYVEALYFGLAATVPPGATSAEGNLGGFYSANPVRQLAADYMVAGKFHLFGLEQQVAVGANYQHVNNDGGTTTYLRTLTVPDIFDFDPYAYTTSVPDAKDFLAVRNRLDVYGIYGNLQLQLLKGLRTSIGMRYSSLTRNSIFSYSYTPDLEYVNDLRDRSHSKPNFSASYDITRNLTAYGSHQNIYQPQTNARYTEGNLIPPPVTGKNDEVGVKWQSPDKRFNASVAGYDIVQNNFLETDYSVPGANRSALTDYKSRGVDVEVGGLILPGWQLSASYSYTDAKKFKEGVKSLPTSFAPRHMVKVWTNYRGTPGSMFEGTILGGGVDYQSRAYTTGYIMSCPTTNPNCYTYVPYEFATNGYTTFSLQGGYQLSPGIEITANVKNVGNVKAYQPIAAQSTQAYNYYIEPRSFLLTLRGKW